MKSSIEARFWKYVKKTPHCWIWTGAIYKKGYGAINVNYKATYAHRISWKLHKGPIPKGMLICHSCDNPPCVNPKHLWIGTHKDNTLDMCKKKRCTNAKLTEEQVKYIKNHIFKRGEQKILSESLNLSRSTINKVVKGKNWNHSLS